MSLRLLNLAAAILALCVVLAGCSGGSEGSGKADAQIDAKAKPTRPRPGMVGSGPGMGGGAKGGSAAKAEPI